MAGTAYASVDFFIFLTPGKWVSRSSRWKEKLQKLEKLCIEQPEKLVQGIKSLIHMSKSKHFTVAKG